MWLSVVDTCCHLVALSGFPASSKQSGDDVRPGGHEEVPDGPAHPAGEAELEVLGVVGRARAIRIRLAVQRAPQQARRAG